MRESGLSSENTHSNTSGGIRVGVRVSLKCTFLGQTILVPRFDFILVILVLHLHCVLSIQSVLFKINKWPS